jgi:hypothetical protein
VFWTFDVNEEWKVRSVLHTFFNNQWHVNTYFIFYSFLFIHWAPKLHVPIYLWHIPFEINFCFWTFEFTSIIVMTNLVYYIFLDDFVFFAVFFSIFRSVQFPSVLFRSFQFHSVLFSVTFSSLQFLSVFIHLH